jgi:hypothetical protein
MGGRKRKMVSSNVEKPNKNYHPSTELDPEHFHIAKFPFLERFELLAIVNKITGERQVWIEYLGLDGTILDGTSICDSRKIGHSLDEIYLINKWLKFYEPGKNEHIPFTPNFIPNAKLYEFVKWVERMSWVDTNLSEGLAKKDITDEKFNEFVKWVERVSKSGVNFIENMDYLSEFPPTYDIADSFLYLLAHHDYSVIHRYLEHVKASCFMDGKFHIPLFIKALYGLRRFIQYSYRLDDGWESPWVYQSIKKAKNVESLIEELLSMGLPLRVYVAIFPYDFIKQRLKERPDYEREMFRKGDIERWIKIASDPDAVQFKRFRLLFSSKNERILVALARNPASYQFAESKRLFESKSHKVLYELASSVEAAEKPEYVNLFSIRKKSFRLKIAANPNAANFPEFGQLLDIKNRDILIEALQNDNVKRFPEYKVITNEALNDPELLNLIYNAEISKGQRRNMR